MPFASSNRVAHLAAIPEPDRRLIEQRLANWDTLPDEMKKSVLEKQSAQRSVLPAGTNTLPTATLFPVPKPDQTSRHDRDVSAWNQQSVRQRQKMVGQFGNFFEQAAPEKEKTLLVLSETERVQMEKTLHAYEKLPPAQRQRCIEAFRKFDLLKRGRTRRKKYGLKVEPKAKVWQLSAGEQQRVEILKALIRGAKVLILDEPTSVLTPQEATDLFKVLNRMKLEGEGVIIITHKLDEVMAVSDRITVLRA